MNGLKIARAFGWILLISSIVQIIILSTAGYEHYAYLHQEYGKGGVLLRYCVSWVIKIMGLVAGIGVLQLKENFRQLAIFNSLFIISTINLKHAYPAYSRYVTDLVNSIDILPYGKSLQDFTWEALIIQRAIDVLFGLILIYFLTRPAVKSQFR